MFSGIRLSSGADLWLFGSCRLDANVTAVCNRFVFSLACVGKGKQKRGPPFELNREVQQHFRPFLFRLHRKPQDPSIRESPSGHGNVPAWPFPHKILCCRKQLIPHRAISNLPYFQPKLVSSQCRKNSNRRKKQQRRSPNPTCIHDSS